MSNQNKRPQNCGTGYCSCIECIYGDNGCVADEEQCNAGCLAQKSAIADALKLADEIDAEFSQGRISNHNGRKAAQMLRMLVDAPVQPVKQEPVGVVEPSEEWGVAGVLIAGLPIGTKLYAAPVSAKREWVYLTDGELKAALEVHQVGLSVRIGRIAIAAFKEKNK